MPLNKQYKYFTRDFTQDFSPSVKLPGAERQSQVQGSVFRSSALIGFISDNNGVFIVVKRLIPSQNCQFLCTGDVVTTRHNVILGRIWSVNVNYFTIICN